MGSSEYADSNQVRLINQTGDIRSGPFPSLLPRISVSSAPLSTDFVIMDSLLFLLTFSLLEAYLLQRSVFFDLAFRTLCLASVGLNLVLLGIWNIIIYPYFVTPLRHLPTLSVSPPFSCDFQHEFLHNIGQFQSCPHYL